MQEQNIILFVLANKEIPGTVISKKASGSLVIEPLVSRIPLQDGEFVKKFFAPAIYSGINNINEGTHVTFIWDKPGERGIDPITKKQADPIATNIRVISREDAWKLVDEITILVSKKEREDWLEYQDLQKREIEICRARMEEDNQTAQSMLTSQTNQLEQERQKITEDRNCLDNDYKFLQEKRKELVRVKQEINRYTALIPLIESGSQEINISPISIPKTIDLEPEELGDNWHKMLASRGLRLPESITASYLISIITALYSGSIVLLNGNVGVGKTSIISKSAELLGGKAEIIPIRPSWLDPSDLLGFFDPLAETFRPSSFTSALKQADNYIDRPFLICLDELNLSRIENYGSDLLSTLKYSKNHTEIEGENRKLSLYSEEVETELWQKLYFLKNIDNPNVEQQLLIQKLQKLNNTPANLEIPKNLVLIGTLNSDETTYDLSPKVIDRAYVITYPPANLELPPWLYDEPGIQEEQLSVSMLQTKVKNCINQIEEMVIRGGFESQSNLLEKLAFNWSEDWKQIIKWNKQYISELGIPVGHRIKREYQIFFSVSHCLGINSNNSKHCLAYFTFTKLLPRLSFFEKGKRKENCQKWIDEIRADYFMGGEDYILDEIEDQISEKERLHVRYWG
jgi:uncharacterized protein YneR